MSYLGFKILYHIVNKERGLAAERVCAPWTDMEAKMRGHGIPLRSLETNKVLKNFDFVGFTLQYELSYSNILNMLDLGQVPVLAAERGEATRLLLLAGRAYITLSLWLMCLTCPLSAKAKKFWLNF